MEGYPNIFNPDGEKYDCRWIWTDLLGGIKLEQHGEVGTHVYCVMLGAHLYVTGLTSLTLVITCIAGFVK